MLLSTIIRRCRLRPLFSPLPVACCVALLYRVADLFNAFAEVFLVRKASLCLALSLEAEQGRVV